MTRDGYTPSGRMASETADRAGPCSVELLRERELRLKAEARALAAEKRALAAEERAARAEGMAALLRNELAGAHRARRHRSWHMHDLVQ